jgi:Lrp/AsnC family transcriptional regulator, regulator for asnA, asnC and gidA
MRKNVCRKGKKMRVSKKKSNLLDALDQNIIRELQVDARESYLDIGKKLHASEGTIRNRVRSALEKGIIKLKAVLNPPLLGFDFSCVLGIEIDMAKLPEAGSILQNNPQVYFLSRCTGSFDLIAVSLFRNTREFDRFMDEVIARLPGLKRTQTFVNMRVFKAPWMDETDITRLIGL